MHFTTNLPEEGQSIFNSAGTKPEYNSLTSHLKMAGVFFTLSEVCRAYFNNTLPEEGKSMFHNTPT